MAGIKREDTLVSYFCDIDRHIRNDLEGIREMKNEIKKSEEVTVYIDDLHRLRHDWGNFRLRQALLLKEFENAIDVLIENIKKGGE